MLTPVWGAVEEVPYIILQRGGGLLYWSIMLAMLSMLYLPCFPLVSLVVVEWCGVGIGGVVRYLLQATQRAQRGEIRVDLKMQDVRENQVIKILQ